MKTHQQSNAALVLILGALCTVSPFAIDMYLSAFPQIAIALGTTSARLALTVSSYFIGLSVGQIAYGPLLDRFGRRRPLIVGLALFVLSSFACTQVHSIEELIILRFLQAVGGCGAQVAAMAMVRDFFPVQDAAKIFSLLTLILGASPLLAPTFGAFVAAYLGWRWIFIMLGGIVAAILSIVFLYLPEGHQPDRSVSLRPGPILSGFSAVFRQPQFQTYAVCGALSFSGLFAYVSGSPTIFLEYFHVSARFYGGIFAFLSVGFIGGSQLNLLFARRFSSHKVFKTALIFQTVSSLTFLAISLTGNLGGGLGDGLNHERGLYTTIFFLFANLASLGLTNPNASALALAPFTRNVGSASALLGFIQIGVGALASAGVGLFVAGGLIPTVSLLCFGACSALLFLLFSPASGHPDK